MVHCEFRHVQDQQVHYKKPVASMFPTLVDVTLETPTTPLNEPSPTVTSYRSNMSRIYPSSESSHHNTIVQFFSNLQLVRVKKETTFQQKRRNKSIHSEKRVKIGIMDDRMVDMIFQGALDPTLPPVSSKIVRIFTSSTFTGMCVALL